MCLHVKPFPDFTMMVSKLNSSSFVFHGFLLGEGWEGWGAGGGGGGTREEDMHGN